VRKKPDLGLQKGQKTLILWVFWPFLSFISNGIQEVSGSIPLISTKPLWKL